jgi:hypothetical protein
MDLVAVAMFLTHLVADSMGSRPTPTEGELGGMRESLAMEVIQNALFHHTEDIGALLARTATFWVDVEADSTEPPFRRAPAEIVEEAVGMPMDYLISTAFLLWAHAQTFSLDRPLALPEAGMPTSLLPHLQSAIRVFTATPNELATAFAGMSQDWQMLPLQQKPVLRLANGLVLLDETYLMERVTSGMFWLAHDSEKAKHGEKAAARWRKSYANLFERYAESRLRTFSVPALAGGTNFYTEEDLQAAYPKEGQRYSDAVLDFGSVVLVAEIVNHQFTVPTRTQGDVQAFRKDLKLGVYEKVRQLDGTSQRLLRDGERLLGRRPTRIQPLLVTGGSFPHSSVTHALIAEHLQASNHLADARIGPLAIVGIDDLDYARIVVDEHHLSLPDTLEGWLKDAFKDSSLRNYLIAKHGIGGSIARRADRQQELARLLDRISELTGSAWRSPSGDQA